LVGRVRVGMPDDRAEIGAEVKPLGVGALGKTCNNNFPASNAALGNTAAGSLPMLGAERTLPESRETSPFVKGFGCRPLEGRRRAFGGRRPKVSKEGNHA
jgi:hypothetical protein